MLKGKGTGGYISFNVTEPNMHQTIKWFNGMQKSVTLRKNQNTCTSHKYWTMQIMYYICIFFAVHVIWCDVLHITSWILSWDVIYCLILSCVDNCCVIYHLILSCDMLFLIHLCDILYITSYVCVMCYVYHFIFSEPHL